MIRPYWPALSALIAAVLGAQKRTEVYAGVSNGSGDFAVVYATPYPAAPHVNPQMIPQSDPNRLARVTASSATGFTVRVEVRATLNVLGLNVIAAAPTAVSGAAVSVLVRQA